MTSVERQASIRTFYHFSKSHKKGGKTLIWTGKYNPKIQKCQAKNPKKPKNRHL